VWRHKVQLPKPAKDNFVPIRTAALFTALSLTTSPLQAQGDAPGGFRQFDSTGSARIVGGEPVGRAQWPSFVLVQSQNRNGSVGNCGGTVISDRWVLTAGHCVAGKAPGDFTVVEEVETLRRGGRRLSVERIELHSSYSAVYEGRHIPRSDIALLRLSAPARSRAQPLLSASLEPTALRPGQVGTVAGFGLTEVQTIGGPQTGGASDRLLEVSLPVVGRQQCAQFVGGAFGLQGNHSRLFDESIICAGEPQAGGRDACNGDSGGPLAVEVNGRRVQAGIVSYGPGCGLRNTVGVYASVPFFEPWVRQLVPEAQFVSRQEIASAPQQPIPASVAQQPIQVATDRCNLPQISAPARVDLEMAGGGRQRINSEVRIRANLPVAGQLLIINVDLSTCRRFQLFPSALSAGLVSGARVDAGARIQIPADSSQSIKVNPPAARNRLYALVLPVDAQISDIAARGFDMQSTSDGTGVLREIIARTSGAGAGRNVLAVGTFDYEIVP
jgi:secreted trypsin-like serine protease